MGTPSQREEILYADEFGQVDPDVYAETVLKWGTVVEKVGGMLMVGAQRVQEDEGGPFVTRAIVFTWRSFVPAQRAEPAAESRVEEPAEPQPEG
jgi:hypothetical protein